MEFKIIAKDHHSRARSGQITTSHGIMQTPIFMPVGTAGTVKAITQQQLEQEVQAQIILGNTYHLYLRPGMEVLEKAGGLHQFMGWDHPILTDSGGYQVFSLAANRKISEEGCLFQSHIDGSRHLFTPEKVMDIQRTIGADIIMAFDECPPYPADFEYARKSMELTHRWLERCKTRWEETLGNGGDDQALFPIVQGSTYPELRKISAQQVASLELEGNAIGGLSVGEPEEEIYAICGLVCDILPWDKPRYLMGVGTPWNILECISMGVDMFDCVLPTRNGRNGMLFTSQGIINIKNKKWSQDFSALDKENPCMASQQYSKAYLRHLFISGEILGLQLASIHNLCFYLELVSKAREKIISGDFTTWKKSIRESLTRRL
ncbi:MAG: tRNA guanosine(34) transglycosylase Tgt [Chitinophagaceae bacterium]